MNSAFLQRKFIGKLKRNGFDFYYENIFLFEKESDIIAVKDGILHEFEFKVGEKDFRKDIYKNRHQDGHPHYFYYVVSSEDIIKGQYLDYAGIYVHTYTAHDQSKFKLIKEPTLIRDFEITKFEMYTLLKKICNGKKTNRYGEME